MSRGMSSRAPLLCMFLATFVLAASPARSEPPAFKEGEVLIKFKPNASRGDINSVLGAGVRNPTDAVAVTRRALELGLTSTVGIIHDGDGQVRAVGERERQIYAQVRRLAKGSYSRINQHNPYQENLLAGKYGRIREVAEGPDGYLYFSTSNRDGRGSPSSDDDRIIRLVPIK